MQPDRVAPLRPKVVLGIAAHPDDLDFGAAGTMARFVADGAEVHYLIITDGSKGSEDAAITPAELTKIRETEQHAAVKVIGGKSVTFLGYPDGELELTMQLKRDVVKVIRSVKPDVVVTMDPSMLYSADRGFINHPDHRAAGQAALDAVFPLARDHMVFPELFAEGYVPHKTKTMLLINFDQGNHYVDIADTFETKIKAINAHTSQVSDPDGTRAWVAHVSEIIGKRAGLSLAESFVRIDIR